MTPWKIRPFQSGDEHQILELLYTVFGKKMSLEQWQWQFLNNLYANPVIRVAETEAKKIVGHYCLIPVPLWQDNTQRVAMYSILSAIHPNYQRQGILKSLATSAEHHLEKEKTLVLLSFLNDNSLPLYTNYFGWKRIYQKLPIYFKILDLNSILNSMIHTLIKFPFHFFPKSKISTGHTFPNIFRIDRYDETIDVLWRRIRKNFSWAVNRDAQYLNWRIVQNPKSYSKFIYKKDGEVLGTIATCIEVKFGLRQGFLVDFFFDFEKPSVGKELLLTALQELKQENCSLVTTLASEPGILLEGLKDTGFHRLPKQLMPHGIHFCGKFRPLKTNQDPGGWFMSWSDHDVI